MKFKFSKDLDYQLDAINAVVGLFEGVKNTKQKDSAILRSPMALVANELEFNTDLVLANLRAIQKQNSIEQATVLDSVNFSVEMETGTGKTYVYLRTIFELNQKHGLTKFIILVPSVAIREGVLKTIEQTREHFKELYDNVIFGSFAYDSAKLRQVRDFIQSPEVQIMIMTTQSFTADTAVMRQTDRDDTYGEESYIKMVAQTRPVVIMDEPQNMEGPVTREALKLLEPLVQLRYSATHKEVHNLVYRLTPVDAYTKGLVKKVEVWGATIASTGDFVFKVIKVVTKKGEAPTAQVQIEVKTASGEYELKEVKIKDGEDLYVKSKKNHKYEGLYVGEINVRDGVELSNGKLFAIEGDDVASRDELFRTQIRETIKAHMRKQQDLGKRIKVLSLFFIDKVENYRGDNAIIKTIFEEEFTALKARSEHFKDIDVAKVHDGYFSQDRKGEGRKTVEVSSEAKCERLTYDLIMRDKEKLLSFDEPLAFIFSHSALKEGWDNPNIFQICTLIQAHDDFTKRQKIGRGLRLPVDVDGTRIYDPKVNVLTVVANESYETFARTLQGEYDAAGYTGKAHIGNAKERVMVTFKKALIDEEFKKLWDKISEKTVYNVALDSQKLISSAIAKIDEMISQNNLAVVVEKVQLEVNKDGVVRTVYQGRSVGESIVQTYTIENIVDRIARETALTRKTILSILEEVADFDLITKNPEAYVRSVIAIINGCKQELVVNEGVQYVPTGDYWKMELFEDFESYANKTIASDKSVYSHVAFDSDGEEAFARNLEDRRDVKVFAKLPSWFKIDTPLGGYNPDWAIVIKEESGDMLYLVRETKFVEDLDNLRPSEMQKIALGKKHFNAIGFKNFKVVQDKSLTDLV